MGKYDDVAIQILEIIKDDGKKDFGKKDEEIQSKITDVLRNNFNVKDEEIGKSLSGDVWLFDPENGHEFYAPLFTLPMLSPLGVKAVRPETFPNYGIENKYIGYTEKGIFYKINDFTRFMRSARKNPIPVILVFILVYILVAIIAVSMK